MGLMGKFNIFGSIKVWLIAISAVLAVVVKLVFDRSERLEKKLEVANEKVQAAKTFRENRRKVSGLSIDDIDADIERMFPPSGNKPDPGT